MLQGPRDYNFCLKYYYDVIGASNAEDARQVLSSTAMSFTLLNHGAAQEAKHSSPRKASSSCRAQP